MEDQYNLYDLADLWHWIRSGRNRRLLNKRTINMPRLPPSPPSPQEVPRSWGTGPQFSPHNPTYTRGCLQIPILVRDSATFRKRSDSSPNSGGALPHPCVFFVFDFRNGRKLLLSAIYSS
ncbi:GD20291 [Drosophila simulans]|uniref:GD20291 n=1 Tax=Drosophila simulans TaxID=7240 RepID=B4QX38_DROSI|nr:GD20291 [Drosophila simulans]